jgi:hypothetical protein
LTFIFLLKKKISFFIVQLVKIFQVDKVKLDICECDVYYPLYYPGRMDCIQIKKKQYRTKTLSILYALIHDADTALFVVN